MCNVPKVEAQTVSQQRQWELDRLRIREQALSTAIQGQRIDRQAEISRLEGRIVKLEKLVRGLPKKMDNSAFITLLLMTEDQVPQDEVEAKEEESSNQDTPEGARRRQIARLIARDYLMELKTEILDAKISLMEHSHQLASLQRLSAKGLATRPQMELQQLKHDHATAHFSRLEQQKKGLLSLFPTLLADSTSELEDTLPEPKDTRSKPAEEPQSVQEAGEEMHSGDDDKGKQSQPPENANDT